MSGNSELHVNFFLALIERHPLVVALGTQEI
jgi:hypothetical protein